MTAWLGDTGDGSARLHITVRPRASRTEAAGEFDGRLRIKVAAPPVDGAANKAVAKFFARVLSVPKSDVEIAAGHTGRNKTVIIHGRSATQVASVLNASR